MLTHTHTHTHTRTAMQTHAPVSQTPMFSFDVCNNESVVMSVCLCV